MGCLTNDFHEDALSFVLTLFLWIDVPKDSAKTEEGVPVEGT
jgi:hypothetical protein